MVKWFLVECTYGRKILRAFVKPFTVFVSLRSTVNRMVACRTTGPIWQKHRLPKLIKADRPLHVWIAQFL
jgi:hypothetical protein